jgi:phosphatidate cytidylyltransferase
MSTLMKRILSAVILAPVVIAAVWAGGWAFYALIAAVFGVGVQEWSRLSIKDGRVAWGILGIGIPYIGLACMAAIWIRNFHENGFFVLLYVFVAIWACDIGAYAFGKAIGGPKMAPHISPNKTWAGMVGGAISSVIVVIAYDVYLENLPGRQIIEELNWPMHAMLGLIIACIGQVGDLLESALKRRAGVKDSGNIIPGHGGLLDRIDAMLLAVPVYAAILLIMEYGRHA